jgi:hypothetical protein
MSDESLLYSDAPTVTLKSAANPLKILPAVRVSSKLPALPNFGPVREINPIFYTHKCPPTTAVNAFFAKYPHPKAPEMLEAVVTEDHTDPDTFVRYRKRVLKVQIAGAVPWWISKMLGIETADFIEESLWDPEEQVLEISSRNQTFDRILTTVEYSKLCRHPENSDWTLFCQGGGVRASGWFGLVQGKFEDFVCKRVRQAGIDSCIVLDDRIRDFWIDINPEGA